jgi:hypothetical protein
MYILRSLLAISWLSILFFCVTAAPIGRPQAQSFDLGKNLIILSPLLHSLTTFPPASPDQHLSPRVVHQGVLHKFVNRFVRKPSHTPNAQHSAAHKHAVNTAVDKHAIVGAFRHAMRQKRVMANMPGKDKQFIYGNSMYSTFRRLVGFQWLNFFCRDL